MLCGGFELLRDWAMLSRVFGLRVGGAAAAVGDDISHWLLEKRITAVGNPTSDHPFRASFADFGSAGPVGMRSRQSQLAELRARGLGGCAT